MILAAVGVVSDRSRCGTWRIRGLPDPGWTPRSGFGVVGWRGSGAAVVVVVASVVLSVLRSLVTYGNLVLRRDPGESCTSSTALRASAPTHVLQYAGCAAEHCASRCWCGCSGGARLDAVMAGADGAGEASHAASAVPARDGRDRAGRS